MEKGQATRANFVSKLNDSLGKGEHGGHTQSAKYNRNSELQFFLGYFLVPHKGGSLYIPNSIEINITFGTFQSSLHPFSNVESAATPLVIRVSLRSSLICERIPRLRQLA